MPVLELEDIKRMIPHRHPFLLLDRVLELEDGKRCKAIKNVSGSEPFFQGHFPGNPVMPGVLIVEAMAQACGIAAFALETEHDKKWLLFAGIEKARFKRPVVPGDQLVIEAVYVNRKMHIWAFTGTASVDGKLVAQAEIRIATVSKDA